MIFMKSSFFSFLLLFVASATAQKQVSFPDFGKIDKTELEMKECSFEKSAGAMVLFDEAESFFKLELNSFTNPVFQQTEHHTRIKIFNRKGFEYANIKIRYRNDRSISIKNFHAQTYNTDASGNIIITKVDKASVYDKEINRIYSERTFVFPDIREGSIIEYKYILDGASESVWYFQKSIPVEISRFIVNFPSELRVAVIPYCNLQLFKGTNSSTSENYSWYTMKKVPALTDEPFMSNPEDYLQRVDMQITGIALPGSPLQSLLRTWPGIIKELIEDEDFGKQLKKDIPRTADLDKMLLGVNDPFQKMKTIHQYVRQNMQWNDRDNIWALDGVKKAWKDKKGTSGEINLILINLLKDAGIKVRPVLVSTRDNGILNTALPGYDQFNKVLAYVEMNGNLYVLDATEKETPSNMIPLEVMASEGLVIEKLENFEWGWKVLWDSKDKFSNSVFINADINENGKISGTATLNSYGYEKIKMLGMLKKGKDNLTEALKNNEVVTVDSLQIADAENDSLPLVEDFQFTAAASTSGDYHYFSVNHFAGLNKNPFVAGERLTDIFYGAKQDYSITGLYFLPEAYTMEDLPKNYKLITSDTGIVFKRSSSFNDGMLNVQMTLEFKKPVYSVENYPEVNEFFKKMYAVLNEQFVYKKK